MISFRALALTGWGVAGAASLYVTPHQMDGYPSLCLFRFWWGVRCPGCGMGHAVIAAFQGRWSESFHYHILGLPLLVVWTLWLVWSYRPRITHTKETH